VNTTHTLMETAARIDSPASSASAGGVPRTPRSIASTLSRRLALMTMAAMALLFYCAWWSVGWMIKERNIAELHLRGEVLADIIELEARTGGEAAVRTRMIADSAMRGDSTLELWFADGRPFYMDTREGARALSAHTNSTDFTIPAVGLPDNQLRARYTMDFAKDHAMGQRWGWIMALFTLGAGTVVSLGASGLIRRKLRPLDDLAAQTRAISADRLDQRLSLKDPPEELRPWIQQFNALMQRLERTYAQLEGFNADVAHELRTPLATLRMQTELALSRERPATELRETMTSSLEELDRLTALVNDMLFLSQADRGAKARRGTASSLADLAREVIEFHEASLDDARLKVEVIGDAVTAVDDALVKRALSNLVGNATRFAEHGSTVRVHIDGGPQGAKLTVENHGPGIDPQQMPRLFDRFYRADVSRCCDDGVPHYGLGLAIVAAIARMHGGAPWASSQAGVTRIGFSLPAA
jgi:two-component system, OmpR family, heavy metal sensor histidine kinase CusS